MILKEGVLRLLRNANLDGLRGLTVRTLAFMTGYPEPSVRRVIAELKALDVPLVRDGKFIRLNA